LAKQQIARRGWSAERGAIQQLDAIGKLQQFRQFVATFVIQQFNAEQLHN
jgi:hypothetical protein